MKPELHQSNMQNFFQCPKKYQLSLEHPFETSDAMREGLLLEGYIFNRFKNDDEKALIGRKSPKTIEHIKATADAAREYFGAGDAFVKLRYETEDYTLAGEADFIGDIMIDGTPIHGIADVKYTGSIEKIWNWKARKEEYLQAVVYPYMVYKSTGQILPFIYILVENGEFEIPMIKAVGVEVCEEDFRWLEEYIYMILHSTFYPCVGRDTCLKNKFGKQCEMLEFCSAGRNLIAGPEIKSFKDLL